jgi:predicted short-subunit dehydrogenase-like oxidoreductase (DUF2520 family)
MSEKTVHIALAGAGNIASHLAGAFCHEGFPVTGIWSRDFAHAEELAATCGARPCRKPEELQEHADLIVIAVPDHAITTVAGSLAGYKGIVVHTAGSVPLDALTPVFPDCGVFYPLQTFSKSVPVDFGTVPVFLEATSDPVMQLLRQVAGTLSSKLYETDSRQRLLVHVAAVFANNFTNLMFTESYELLKHSGLPPEVLQPLILETARKAVSGLPSEMQTGPARRGDTLTIEKHLEALVSYPAIADLYRILSERIGSLYS